MQNDYSCESANKEFSSVPEQFSQFHTEPLWDGTGCSCCNNCPWFYKQLPQPTTDDIEMRACRDEEASNEDIAIEMIEIYVQ